MSGEPLTPRDEEIANGLLIESYKADPANWRTDPVNGSRYYVGPDWAGDGTIDYPDWTPDPETAP